MPRQRFLKLLVHQTHPGVTGDISMMWPLLGAQHRELNRGDLGTPFPRRGD